MFIVLGPSNGQWMLSLAVGSSTSTSVLWMWAKKQERGSPCADEALEVKMLVKLLQTTLAPGGFTYQVKTMFIGTKAPGRY